MATDGSESDLPREQEEKSIMYQVDLYRQLKEQLIREAETYKRSGREQLAKVILQSLE